MVTGIPYTFTYNILVNMAMFTVFDSEVKFTILGFTVHILYLYSVLDIYFKSPILQGLSSVSVSYNVPAKRLVLISADGLQAEKAFHRKYVSQTSFLRSVIMHNGSWGVSHTRAPTETRTGHVSIVAGTYEDVSAIMNGWKSNPVDFDSVINQSSTTWYWGHGDIIHIFDQGLKNIKSYCFESDEVDFADKDPSRMDKWVFDRVEEFFLEAQYSEVLKKELHEDKILFFLHLSGLDTNGHAMKPDSTQYIENVRVVDEGVKKVNKIFESFYGNDGLTSYILTSDHGMTPWGTHGSGMRSETETPFIGWGAGILQPKYERNINADLQSAVWGLEDYQRHDIQQVDLAPLIAFLIGCPIPANSVGQLPLEVVNGSEEEKAVGMLMNVKQIRVQYKAHEENVLNTAFSFENYSHITDFRDYHRLQRITDLIEAKQFQTAINESKIYISHALNGVHYYKNYHRLYLSFVVNIGFISWMLLVVLKIIKGYTSLLVRKQSWCSHFFDSKLFSIPYYCAAMIYAIMLWYRSKNYAFIVLSLLPLVMIKYLINEVTGFNVRNSLAIPGIFIKYGPQLLLVMLGVEMMVLAFFQRGILSVLGVCLSLLPWMNRLSTTKTLSMKQKCACISWTIFTLMISIFPQFPVVTREERYILVLIGGFIGTTIGFIYSLFNKNPYSNIIAVITAFMGMTIAVKMHSVVSIKNGNGLPIVNQIFSWSSLFVFPAASFLVDATSITRVVLSCMSLFSIYILTSISYEVLFLVNLICLLTTWIFMEVSVWVPKTQCSQIQNTEKHLTSNHLRISFIFLYLIFLSFFGTGNIASVNSFDIASTYCFQTVLNKTLQGMILFIKMFIPFAVVTIFFRSLQSLIALPIRAVFLLVLLMTDLMAVHFFFLIKEEGSWVDIGESVSHFIITILFIVVLVPIYHFSYFISGQVTLEGVKDHSS